MKAPTKSPGNPGESAGAVSQPCFRATPHGIPAQPATDFYFLPLAAAGTLEPGELDAILAIENQAHPTPWSARAFAQSTGTGYELTGLFERPAGPSPTGVTSSDQPFPRGQLLGYTVVYAMARERTLMNIAVEPGRQGQGFGTMLLEAAVRRACDEQGRLQERFFLEVRERSQRAIRLYEKIGFRHIGRRPGYYPLAPNETEHETALVMRLG